MIQVLTIEQVPWQVPSGGDRHVPIAGCWAMSALRGDGAFDDSLPVQMMSLLVCFYLS